MRAKLGAITSKLPADVKNFLDRVRETLTRGDFVTSDELTSRVNSALADIEIPTGGGTGEYIPPTPIIPPAPTGVTATGSMTSIFVQFDAPIYTGHAYAEIWRANSDNIGVASLVGQAPGALFSDPVGSEAAHYYWVRFVSTTEHKGVFNGTTGTFGQTAPDVAYLKTQLAGGITTSELATALNTRINLIDGSVVTPGTVAFQVAAEAAARTSAISAEALARGAAIANEAYVRQTADDALAQRIILLSAGSGEQFDYKSIWYFDSGAEGWSGNGTPTATGGWLRPANQASGAYVFSPTGIGALGSQYTQVKFRIRKTGTPAFAGYLWWRASTDSTWDTARRIALTEPTYEGGIGLVTVDVPWTTITVDRIRIDLSSAQTATDYFELDWVAVGRPSPGASSAQMIEEQIARATADSALTTSVNTLTARLNPGGDISTAINTAQSTATTGVVSAATAQTTADAKIKTFFQTTAPTATSVGDLWIDTDDNNKIYRWSGTAWVVAHDARITSTASTVATLSTTVAGNTASIQANTSSIDGLKAVYNVKLDVNGHVSGYGIYGSLLGSQFIANVDQFAVTTPLTSVQNWTASTAYAANKMIGLSGNTALALICKVGGISGGTEPSFSGKVVGDIIVDGTVRWQVASRVPFAVLTSSATINGTAYSPGVYFDGGYLINATIHSAQIALLAVDDARIANVSAGKLIANSVIANDIYVGASEGNASMRLRGANKNISVYDNNGLLRACLGKYDGVNYGLAIYDDAGQVILTSGGQYAAALTASADPSNSNWLTNTELVGGVVEPWVLGWNPDGAVISPLMSEIERDPTGYWVPPGVAALVIEQIGRTSGATDDIACDVYQFGGHQTGPACQPGDRHEFHAMIAAHRCDVQLVLGYFDSSGNWIGGSNSGVKTRAIGGQSLSGWLSVGVMATAPAGAARFFAFLRKYNTDSGQTNSYAWIAQPFLSKATANQTGFSAYSPGTPNVTDIFKGDLNADRTETAIASNVFAGMGGLTVYGEGIIQCIGATDRTVMSDGNVITYRKVNNVEYPYRSLNRSEYGVAVSGAVVNIPGFFISPPRVMVSPYSVPSYLPAYSGQGQTLRCRAENLEQYGVMQWRFTARADVVLQAGNGTTVVAVSQGPVSTTTLLSAQYVTPNNCASITPNVALLSARGDGSSLYFKRTAKWRVEYYNGSTWVTSDPLLTVNLTESTALYTNSSKTFTFPSAGTWTWRIYVEYSDTDGTKFGSQSYSYSQTTVTGPVSAVTASALASQNYPYSTYTPDSETLTYNIGAGTGSGEIYELVYTFDYAINFTGAGSGASGSISASTITESQPSLFGDITRTTISLTAAGANMVYDSTVSVYSYSSGPVRVDTTLYQATCTIKRRTPVANSTTQQNYLTMENYGWALSGASILAAGEVAWVAIGD